MKFQSSFQFTVLIYFILIRTFIDSTSALAHEFNFKSLKTLIITKQIKSIENLLPLLPTELRSNYTLIHTSRGIQGASPLNPRAILFGSDAQLVLTFNGDSTQAGFNHLEVLAFNNKEEQFELSEISFEKSGHLKPTFSNKNPLKCMSCHVPSSRPIWEQYRAWTGAYGSNDDQIDNQPQTNIESELGLYKKFASLAKTHPRYRHLIQRSKSPISPYYSISENSKIDLYRPNMRLGYLLSRLQAKSVYRRLKNEILYNQYKTLLFMLLIECPFHNPNSFLTELEQTQLPQSTPHDEHAGERNPRALARGQASLYKRSFPFMEESPGLQSGVLQRRLQNLLNSFLKIDVFKGSQELWLGFNNYSQSAVETSVYSDGMFSNDAYLTNSIFIDLIREFPELKKFYRNYQLIDLIPAPNNWIQFSRLADRLGKAFDVEEARKSCDRIETFALAKMKKLNSNRQHILQSNHQPSPSPPSVFLKCIGCHTDEERFGPEIPFDNMKALSEMLKKDKSLFSNIIDRITSTNQTKRMPLGSKLEAVEVEAIKTRLIELKSED